MVEVLETISGLIFGLMCHQDPSVLMEVGGRAVLLCPRCIGLHLGFLSSFVLLSLPRGTRIVVRDTVTKLLLAMAIGSMAIDWGMGSFWGLFAPTTLSRLVTGLATGSALSVIVAAYRGELTIRSDIPAGNLTGTQTGSLICISLCFGLLAMAIQSWVVITTIVLISVMSNAAIVIHTIALLFRSRLSKYAVA